MAQIPTRHMLIRATEIYSHLCNKHFHHVVRMLPNPGIDTFVGTPYILEDHRIVQVVEKRMVGDAGFEPATSTV